MSPRRTPGDRWPPGACRGDRRNRLGDPVHRASRDSGDRYCAAAGWDTTYAVATYRRTAKPNLVTCGFWTVTPLIAGIAQLLDNRSAAASAD